MTFPWRMILLVVAWLGAGRCGAAEARAPFVAGYERLRQAGGETQSEQGEVLLSELSCLACHTDGQATAPLGWKPGPDLATAGQRLRAEYVRAFLADPAAGKPGTTMPHLLAGETEPRRAEMAEDLTHYVMSLRGEVVAPAKTSGKPEEGEHLFESIGCIACHSQAPLERLGEKYAPGELARFLEKPLAVRPAGRMPDLHLTGEEAAHLAAYLAPQPKPATPPAIDVERAKRGAEHFKALGCATCHGGAEATAKAAQKLDLQSGCLAKETPPGVPRYPLAEEQRTALRAALTHRKNPANAVPPGASVAINRLLLQRNCYACHARGGTGGPAQEVAVHFTSTKDDLGDLGRLPPPLDGVGRKLQPWALQAILRGKSRVRNYMRVRMPDFGEALSPHLAGLLAQADRDPKEEPSPATANPNQVGRNDPGRALVGTGGYACIACHSLHGHPSLGIGAYDLAEVPRRLRPEWVRDFLLNPAAFPTGTRMPAFWPNRKPLNPKIGGNSADRQIDSIRVYLTEVDQSLPPEGIFDHAAFELKPAERPIIFRTFIADVSTHAIAVGFPGGVNAAFDALSSRWALAWRGRFLDADGTWNQRVAKMEKPLGESQVRLEQVGALSAGDATPKYRGYRVSADGVPTFLYDLGALKVEDRLEPAGKGLRRVLRVRGQGSESVRLRANPPKGVTIRLGPNTFTAANPGETPLEFRNGEAELVEEISW